MTVTLLPPFDHGHLDALLEGERIAAVVATSPHNVRYLLGSYSEFFASFDAIGIDRHLPAVVVPRAPLGDAFAVGHSLDSGQHAVRRPWVPELLDASQSVTDTARLVADGIRRRGLRGGRIGIEPSFAPNRFVVELARELRGTELVDATSVLEELRAVKQPHELALMRQAADAIVAAIAATAAVSPGASKDEIVQTLHVEEARRGLDFEYCLIAVGTSFHRAASAQRWQAGEVLSLDSGGRFEGYIGDLCRMAVSGPPSAELEDLLAEVRAVQDAAMGRVQAGVVGREVYEVAADAVRRSPHAERIEFVAHGVGLVPHEAPRLSDSTPIRYPATHAERPLEAGMVLSIETDLRLEGVGLVKLEDTVAVTDGGCEAYGGAQQDWIAV